MGAVLLCTKCYAVHKPGQLTLTKATKEPCEGASRARRNTSRKPQPRSPSLRQVVARARPLRRARPSPLLNAPPSQGQSANRSRAASLSQGRVVASTPGRQPKRSAHKAPVQPVAKTQVPGCRGFHILQLGLPRSLHLGPPLRPRYRLQRGSLTGPQCTPRLPLLLSRPAALPPRPSLSPNLKRPLQPPHSFFNTDLPRLSFPLR